MRRLNARPPLSESEATTTMDAASSSSKLHQQLRPLLPAAAAPSARASLLSRPSKHHHHRVLLLAAFAVAALLLYLFIASRVNSDSAKFAVFIDGGSTGTRVHVFAYRASGWGAIPVALDLTLTASMKVTPGMSSYSGYPQSAGESLMELLKFGKRRVPRDLLGETEIRLMATAGLRLLDAVVAERILNSCRKVLRSSGFRFQDNWATIISGVDEGIYAWVAANYALGTLGADPEDTTGILELGGASAQITFVPRKPPPKEFSHLLKFGELTYNLYSHSFLQLGQNVAYESLHQLLSSSDIKSSSESLQEALYQDPCTPRGYLRNVESLKLSAAVGNSNTQYRSAHAVGNFSECRIATLRLLEKERDKCLYQHCYLGSAYTPKLEGKFLATENFFYTSKFFGLGPKSSLSGMMLAGERFCNEDWLKLKRKYHSLDEEDLLQYCFSAAYIVALLHDSLGIALDDDRVLFANQVQDIPLDWALGAFLVHKASSLNEQSSDWFSAFVSSDSWALLYLFLVSSLLIFAAWSLLKWRKPQIKTIYDLEKGRYILMRMKR